LSLRLGPQFFVLLFQGLRFGSPPIARSTQIPDLGTNGLDPSLQLLVLRLPEISASFEKSRQHSPRARILPGFLVASLGTFHRLRLHPEQGTPSHDPNSATDLSDSASPDSSQNGEFSTPQGKGGWRGVCDTSENRVSLPVPRPAGRTGFGVPTELLVWTRVAARRQDDAARVVLLQSWVGGIDKPEAQAKVLKKPSLALQACGALT
jgi:hypothetical protein